MAVGPYNGRFASVTHATSSVVIECLGSWNINMDTDLLDASVFGTVWGKSKLGQIKWSGSVSGFYSVSTSSNSNGQYTLLNDAINQTLIQDIKFFLNSTGDGSTTAYFFMPNCSTDITNYSTLAGAYIGNVKIGQEKNGLASVSYDVVGDGPLALCMGASSVGIIY